MTPSEGNMALRKFVPSSDAPSIKIKRLSFPVKLHKEAQLPKNETTHTMEPDVEIDIREVYFLIMHFLSSGPCHRTYGQLWNELLEHQLLPRRYHAWYSRNGGCSRDENDDGLSFPLSYNKLVERYPHIDKDHLIKLLKQLILNNSPPSRGMSGGNAPNAADVPTLLGMCSFSLLSYDRNRITNSDRPPAHMRWPHMKADQVRGLSLREIGGGFSRHQRAPSVRAACYAVAKPSTMVQKMQNVKRLRGHRNAVYCAIFDRLGRYVITGSDDRLVKIWSMETAYCLASCRGHEGDITDLAVSSNNAVVASSSNDFIIRVWRLPDGLPISVLRGHTGAVTAIAFSPRPGYQLLSSSDDGTCRLWDARSSSQHGARIYIPRPPESVAGRNSGPSTSTAPQSHQIFCCAFNANGTIFVTGSSDTLARVWSACKPNSDNSDEPNHEIDVLAGHENDVNYVQFSGCAVASRFTTADTTKEVNAQKFKNSWFTHDNIVTCSRDGSAIIWVPRSRRSHGKAGRWTRAYHLKVPPPPMPPQPTRGGPRQRILPTPRGVNMIIWSLDNRFVLAAIMDCRICVWNASDGSLVHSLTGHTDSTYVLDVHPFNPRIAMSAGYDGKTIIWDIWEGTPIRIYEISRFKLVDGKFSSDGTSIILSDDVGQLYILSTGQGESQNDAKYDQFFLGDYRPLIQDTYGNVVDQETQLAPYRRNMQDLLCDSGMIPYPEPYQSTYQQRRLGALGVEWHPSSLKLAVGPAFSLDPDYQMLPLADLDIMIEPLPEFVDAMDWEPQNEVQSDDADSEYNVTEDYSAGVEQGSLSSNSSVDHSCSADDSADDNEEDGLRRSKRKKQKAELEMMTSSGRRVKRRNLDECDGNSVRTNRHRKSKVGHKPSKRKSASKSLRPQRVAARNALHLFSKITGTSTDGEDEEVSGGDMTESESTLHDSNIESDESGKSLQNIIKRSKGKELCTDENEDVFKPFELPESGVNSGNKRLVLKLPIRYSNKFVTPSGTIKECSDQVDVIGSSSKACWEATELNQSRITPLDHEARDLLENVDRHLNLLEVNKNGNVRWGGFRARTSKRLRLGETSSVARARSSACFDGPVLGNLEPENYSSAISPHLKIQEHGDGMDTVAVMNTKDNGVGPSEVSHAAANGGEPTCFSESRNHHECLEVNCMVPFDATTSSFQNGIAHPPEESERAIPVSAEIKLKNISMGFESPPKHEMKSSAENLINSIKSTLPGSSQNPVVPLDDGSNRNTSNNRNDSSRESDILIDKNSLSTSHEMVELHSQTDKMFSAVYRRSKSHKSRNKMEGSSGMEENTSCLSNNPCAVRGGNEGTIDVFRRTRSSRLKPSTHDQNYAEDNPKSDEEQELEHTLRCSQNSSANRSQLPREEWGSSSKMTVGLRSARHRRGSYVVRDTSPIDRRKSHQAARKGSWLMMSAHEGGSRYIPQLGDEVVYLRQGHQEYLDGLDCYSREVGPWTTMNIRAMEVCKVVELEYSTFAGSGDSCCKMKLEFVDPTSDVSGKSFRLTLTEMTSFPDFLVERTRFDAAMQRNWTFRDKCKVWWKNEGEEDGSWWDGRIVSVKAKSSEFPESPWEKYTIRYKTDPTELHLHSPWELYDADTQWEQPHIDDESKAKLLSAFHKLEESCTRGQDRYGVQDLRQVSQRPQFRNRFPVPLSFDVILSRLQNDYYRSLEALEHDITVMLSNFESHSSKNEHMLKKIKRLSDWFARTLSSL